MTQKPAVPPGKKSTLAVIKGAVLDLFVLALMLCAAVFGGYYWGTHQKLAVVELVPPGTPGAREAVGGTKSPTNAGNATATTTAASTTSAASTAETSSTSSSPNDANGGSTGAANSTAKAPAKHAGKTKYWLSSTGTRMIGYAIAVTVNGQPVDNFFAPGKQVDITDMVKKGKNTVAFDAKVLEDRFNQHKGDENAVMTVSIDSGSVIQESVKPSDVLLSYKRNAAETENYTDTKSFTVE